MRTEEIFIMKKIIVIAGILMLGLFAGCGQTGQEDMNEDSLQEEQLINNSETQQNDFTIDNNGQTEPTETREIEEKVPELWTYWSVETEEYQVCLKDLVPGESQQLVLIRENKEILLDTFNKEAQEVAAFAEGLIYGTFEDLMGYDGFYIGHINIGQLLTTYYALEGEKVLPLADSWSFDEEPDNYMLDIDEDGERELICNVVWGDGYQDVVIYDYDGEQVRYCNGTDLLDEEHENRGIGSQEAEYVSKKNVVRISYWKDELEDYAVKDYELNLDNLENLEWYPYSSH